MDCMRKAGRQRNYREHHHLHHSLALHDVRWNHRAVPHSRVVIGEHRNFGGNEEFLHGNGVEVVILDDPNCITLMARRIAERPELWSHLFGGVKNMRGMHEGCHAYFRRIEGLSQGKGFCPNLPE